METKNLGFWLFAIVVVVCCFMRPELVAVAWAAIPAWIGILAFIIACTLFFLAIG